MVSHSFLFGFYNLLFPHSHNLYKKPLYQEALAYVTLQQGKN